MTDSEINRTIAEDRGWKLESSGYWFKGDAWCDPPNYLDEKNPGPAHELIEVLRNEGWRVRIEMPEHLGPKDYVRVELFRPSEQRGPYYAPTFCRAVCEAYLKVRGKWK